MFTFMLWGLVAVLGPNPSWVMKWKVGLFLSKRDDEVGESITT